MMNDAQKRTLEKMRKAMLQFQADNERLRALVKEYEWVGADEDGYAFCQWCLEYRDDHAGKPVGKHSKDCPAFNKNGTVR